jgi:putative ABC transport system substrate-binding protein
MNRREAIFALLGLGITSAPLRVSAQIPQPAKLMRIGLLPAGNENYRKWIAGFMREFNWIEGRDFNFVWFDSGYRTDQLETAAKRLVAENPDLIIATGDGFASAAQRLTTTIPIVLWVGGYPVEEGLANTLARPGKNLTGNSNYVGMGVFGKFVELLHAAKPNAKRIGVLFDYVPPFTRREVTEACLQEMRRAARAYGMTLHIAEVPSTDQVEAAIIQVKASRPDALIATSGTGLAASRQRVAQFALEQRLPLIVDSAWPISQDEFPMIVYAPTMEDLMRRAASYVDRILKGAKAGELPIQQPAKFELVLNLKTARAIGLAIPPSLLLRADKVIE